MRPLAIVAVLAILGATPAGVAAQQAPAPPKPAAPAGQAPAAPPAAQAAPATPLPFPQGAKYAWVDLQRVAADSIEGKTSNAKIQTLAQKKQTDAAEKNKQLTTNQQKLQSSGGVMSESARSQLEKEIERQQVEAQRFQQDAQAELNELGQSLQNEFQTKLFPLLQQVATERGLQFLFSRADAGIVWADPALDLTVDVIKKLDAASVKPAAAPPKQ